MDLIKRIIKKFKNTKTDKQKIGKIGEDSVCKYLKNKGFSVIGRNYLKKYGEIDIVAKKQGIIHFIEVKSVTREINPQKNTEKTNVSRETYDNYSPEDNLHPWKLKRLRKTIETYILEKNIDENQNWQCDFAIVYIDKNKRIARVSFIEDVVF